MGKGEIQSRHLHSVLYGNPHMWLGLLEGVLSNHILGMTRTRLGGSVSPALLMAPGEEFLLQNAPRSSTHLSIHTSILPTLFDLRPSIINLAATRRRYRHGDIPISVRHQAVPLPNPRMHSDGRDRSEKPALASMATAAKECR